MKLKFYFVFYAFLCCSFVSSAQITVNIVTPTVNQLIGNTLSIKVTVTSTYQVSLVAVVSGRQTFLQRSTDGSDNGTLSLAGLPTGDTLTLTVTATDHLNNSTTATRKFIYDVAPQLLTISTPTPETVGNNSIRLKANWVDRDSCLVQVYFPTLTSANLIYTGNNIKDSIDVFLNLSSRASASGQLIVKVTDKKNLFSQAGIAFHLENSPFLQELVVSDKKIFDFNHQKLLVGDSALLSYAEVIDINTKSKTTIPFKIKLLGNSFLTPYGALLGGIDSSQNMTPDSTRLYEWHLGTIQSLGKIQALCTKGNYVCLGKYGFIYLMNLINKTTILLDSNRSWYYSVGINDVASNGLVTYSTRMDSGYRHIDIIKYLNGSRSTIASQGISIGGSYLTRALTDGKNIAYGKTYNGTTTNAGTMYLNNGVATTTFPVGDWPDYYAPPFRLNNNFFAYAKTISGVTQVFLIDSTGQEKQITYFSSNSTVDFVNSKGEVAYRNSGKRYLVLKDSSLIEISALGQLYHEDFTFYLLLGRTVYKLNFNLPKNICPGSTTSIASGLTGLNYQWQVDTASGFVNISDTSRYGGFTSNTLTLKTMPSSTSGYKYRAIVDGRYTFTTTLRFQNKWIGTSNTAWETATNWSCGSVPDANSDIIIQGGTIQINSNVTVRTLTLLDGAVVRVTPGFTLTITN